MERQDLKSVTFLHQLLESAARSWPDREAVVQGKERRSYRYLDENATRLGNALVKAGIRKGDRVGILMPNSVPFLCAYFGISKVGGIAVPINTAVNGAGFPYILQDAGIRALLFDGSIRAMTPHVREALGGLAALFTDSASLPAFTGTPEAPAVLRSWDEVFQEESSLAPGADLSPDDLACLMYTSGSTGRAKGVMISHRNIVANTRSILDYLNLTERDRMMVILPFFYCYGASLIHTHVAVGGSLVLENQFLYPNKVLDTMAEEEVTGFAGVPSSFAILLRRSSLRTRVFPRLRYVTQAGGSMAPSLIRELRQALPGVSVYVMYGQTEATARLSCLAPEHLESKLGSIGKAIPGVELKVLNEQGEEVAPGEVGEIVARGENIMKGYWNSPEETNLVLDERGLHTGDLGRVDEEGFLYVVDRKKDMIKSGSHRVSAREIEEVILSLPTVLECAAIGVPDEMLGEVVKAFVVPVNREGVDEAQIIRFCKEHLPPYKVPRMLSVVQSLPRNEAGKILKGELRSRGD